MAATWMMILGTLIVILAWFFLILRIRWLGLGRIGGMLLCSMLMIVTTVESSDEAVGLFQRVAPSLVTILALDVMVILLSRQHLYDRISHLLTWKCTSALEMIIRVSFLVAILSAFLSADTVTMAVTPIIVQMCERHDLPHGPFLVTVATSANIGATCTPLGSIQNIVIISLSRIGYVSFVRYMGPATAFALLCNIILLFLYYWKQLKGISIQWTHGKLLRVPEHKVYVRAMRHLERQHEKEYKNQPKWKRAWFELWSALNPSTACASREYAMNCLHEYEKQQQLNEYLRQKQQQMKQIKILKHRRDNETYHIQIQNTQDTQDTQRSTRHHHVSHVYVHVQPSTRQPSLHSQLYQDDDQHQHQHHPSHPHIHAHEAEYQPSHSSSQFTSSSPSQQSPQVRMAGNELDVAHRINHVQLRDDIPGDDVMSQMAHRQAQATHATIQDQSDEWVDPAHANAGEARHRVQHVRRMDDRFGGIDSLDQQIMEMAEQKQMGEYTIHCDQEEEEEEEEEEQEEQEQEQEEDQHGEQVKDNVHHDDGHHENENENDSNDERVSVSESESESESDKEHDESKKTNDILHEELAPSAHHPSCPQHEYPSHKDMLIIVRKMQLDQYIELGLLPRSAAINMETQQHSRTSKPHTQGAKQGQSKRHRFSWKHRHEIPPKPACTCQGRKKTPLDMQPSQPSQHIVDIPMQNISSPIQPPRFHTSPMSQQHASHEDVHVEKHSQHHKHHESSHHQSHPPKKSHDIFQPAPPMSPTSRLRAVIPAYRPTNIRVARAWLPRQLNRPLVILPPTVVHPHVGGDRKLLLFLAIFITTIGLYLADWPIHWVTLAGAVAMIVVDLEEPEPVLQAIDWGTVVYLVALVIVIGGFQKTEIPEAFWDKIRYTVEPADGKGIAYFSLLVFIGSNLFSNLPLILLVQTLIFSMNDPFTSWLILAWITSVAGNLTLMGSVTNLIVTQRAKTYYRISQAEYGRFGLPSTLLLRVIGVVVIAWRTKGDANILLH